MPEYKTVFARFEKKYVITRAQKARLLALLGGRLTPDAYGQSTVCNIYFDTPDFRLIRNSIEKPQFKEKLRIRAYNYPGKESNAFVEIKRKVGGVVYKRRVSMPYGAALDYLLEGKQPQNETQIVRELNYFKRFYVDLRPAVALFYDRTAYYGRENSDLRLTFDTDVRYRTEEIDLSLGDGDTQNISDDRIILEIKCADSFPLWLCEALSALQIYPASFSKYGAAYQKIMSQQAKSTALRVSVATA